MSRSPEFVAPQTRIRWANTAWAFATLVATALTWAQFRSFDALDAATHFLIYEFPSDNPDRHTHFAEFARPVWRLCGGNIVVFRLVTLGLLLSAATFFWNSWRRISPSLHAPVNALLLGLSALAGVAWLPVFLGYNSLSTIFALLALGSIARAAVSARNGRRIAASAWITTTALATLACGLAKPPAGAAIAAAGVILAGLQFPLTPRTRRWLLFGAACLVAATAVWTGQLLLKLKTEPDTLFPFVGGIRISYRWVLENIARYHRELGAFGGLLVRDLPYFAPAGIVLAGAVLRPPGATARLATVAAGLLAVGALAATGIRGLWDGSFQNAVTGEMARLYLSLWIVLALPACVAAIRHRRRADHRILALSVILLILPFAAGVGSTNTLYFSALHWTVFWTTGLLLAALELARIMDAPWLARATAMLLLLAAASHLFSGHFLRPYMHQPPLWKQTTPVTIGHPGTTLRVDARTAALITDVRTVLERHGFQPGDDVFGFFNLPGIVYAIGGKQPGAPWYFGTWYHGDDNDGGKLRQVPIARRQRAWILTQADVTGFHSRFRECGIDFPDGYIKLGEMLNPTTGLELAIWKPTSRP